LPDPDNPFQIDSADVAGMGFDTRHLVLPGKLAALRMGRFPGSRSKFTIKGRAHYPTLVAYGPLRAADFDTLYGYIQQHQDNAGTIGSVPVSFHETTFNNCDWTGFELLRPNPVAYRDADGEGVQVLAQFIFEIIADPS
jgi:hypothetical protein